MIKSYNIDELRAVFFDKAHETFLLLDKDLFILDASEELFKVLKLSKDNVIGQHIAHLSPGIESTDRYQKYLEVLKTGQPCFLDQHTVNPILGKYVARVRIFKVGDGLGIAALNITDLMNTIGELKLLQMEMKITNEQLEYRNRDLEDISYVMAHDLRAPISNIHSLLEILKNQKSISIEGQPVVVKINDVLDQLFNKITALNKVISIKTRLNSNKEEIDFSELLRNLKNEISEMLDKPNIQIKEDFSKCLKVVYNGIQMHSIIHNLLTNAIKYRDPTKNHLIELESDTIQGRTRISIKDNGLGFDNENGEIFKLFKRIHTHVEGMGMGLYIVKSIVYSNGGFIEVFSEPNKGTIFNIYI